MHNASGVISKSEKRQRNTVRPPDETRFAYHNFRICFKWRHWCNFQTVRSCFVGSSSDIDADRRGMEGVMYLFCLVRWQLSTANTVTPVLVRTAKFFVVAVCGFLMRFVPGIMMGYITVKTTTVSEFVAAMKKLHLPEQIIIPMSVIFRFFPTVVEEYNAIGDAMKMRGIRFGGGKAGAMLEYRLVPVIMCSVKIGEELSAAALTRGLGGSVKRTNICEIGFHVQDILFLLLCVVAFAIPIATMIAGR